MVQVYLNFIIHWPDKKLKNYSETDFGVHLLIINFEF